MLSRWANYILSVGSEVIVWCVLSCGDLIEFKRQCSGGMHQACYRIGMCMPGMVTICQGNYEGEQGSMARCHAGMARGLPGLESTIGASVEPLK